LGGRSKAMKDPVCGMEVREGQGFDTDYNGKKYFFCSFACQSEFAKDPEGYVRALAQPTVKEIMSTEVDFVDSDSSALDVSKLMYSKGRGCVLVKEGDTTWA